MDFLDKNGFSKTNEFRSIAESGGSSNTRALRDQFSKLDFCKLKWLSSQNLHTLPPEKKACLWGRRSGVI